MADQKELTFESIDEHIRKANLASFDAGGAHHVTAELAASAPGTALANLCRIYHVVRPILAALLLLPFIPAAWKKAIKTFMAVLDTLCPGH